MASPDPRTPHIAFCVAVAFALLQVLLPNGNPEIDLMTLFSNGFAVAIYAPIIRWFGPSPRVAACVNLGLLGITHFLWLLLASLLIRFGLAATGLSGVRFDNASLFIATGLVFSAVLMLDFRTPQAAAIMLVATAASACAELTGDVWRAAPYRPHVTGLPAAPLHIGIALTLFLAARREHIKRDRSRCAVCGYDLTGLGSDVCPECGKSA